MRAVRASWLGARDYTVRRTPARTMRALPGVRPGEFARGPDVSESV